tara:strand:+ start:2711 stop:3355 length:645 start_codon:yes stop_codon:yes gene_type:complete
MSIGAQNYIDNNFEHFNELANRVYQTQLTYQNSAHPQYNVNSLVSVRSQQNTHRALLKYDNNKYALVVFTQGSQKDPIKPISSTLTINEMVQKIRNTFGLNNVQVADIIRVSRPSLYNHIADKESPKSLETYQTFYEIAEEVSSKIKKPLKPGLKSILVNGKTLLAHLKDRNVDKSRIVNAAIEISKKLEESHESVDISTFEQRKISHRYTKAG